MKVIWGKAWKFSDTAGINVWESREGTEMTKGDMEYYFLSPLAFGVYTDEIHRGGWAIKVRGLRRYVVGTERGEWREVTMPNKTYARKKVNSMGLGRVVKIIDITEE